MPFQNNPRGREFTKILAMSRTTDTPETRTSARRRGDYSFGGASYIDVWVSPRRRTLVMLPDAVGRVNREPVAPNYNRIRVQLAKQCTRANVCVCVCDKEFEEWNTRNGRMRRHDDASRSNMHRWLNERDGVECIDKSTAHNAETRIHSAKVAGARVLVLCVCWARSSADTIAAKVAFAADGAHSRAIPATRFSLSALTPRALGRERVRLRESFLNVVWINIIKFLKLAEQRHTSAYLHHRAASSLRTHDCIHIGRLLSYKLYMHTASIYSKHSHQPVNVCG